MQQEDAHAWQTKMKKIFVMMVGMIMISMILISLVSAGLGTFKKGECVQIKTILNSTWANVSTISFPNSTIAATNIGMTKQGQTFNYTFCLTNDVGIYSYDYFDNHGEVYVNDFEVTTSGYNFDTTTATGLIIGLVAISGLLFFVSTLFSKERHSIKTLFICFGLGFLILTAQTAKIIISDKAYMVNIFSTALTGLIWLFWLFISIIVIIYIKNLFIRLRDMKKAKEEGVELI